MKKIIPAAKKMLSGRLRVFSIAEKVLSGMERIFSANQKIARATRKVFVVPAIIRSGSNKVFSAIEMILSPAVSYKILIMAYLQRHEKVISVTDMILGDCDLIPSPMQKIFFFTDKTGLVADFMYVMTEKFGTEI